MKKLTFLAGMLIAASFSSCNSNSSQNPTLATELDTISYALGFARTDGFSDYLAQYGVTEENMVSFLKGVHEGINKTTEDEKAYTMGVQIGQTVASWKDDFDSQLIPADSLQYKSFNRELIIQGFLDGVNGKEGLFSVSEASAYANMKTNAMYTRMQSSQYTEQIKAAEQYMAENKTKEGVVTTASGLQYKIIKQGDGAIPTASSTVKVNYWGKLTDGTQFDSSYDRGEPAEFAVNSVISGWTEILQLMPVGSTYEVYVPYNLGYGTQANSSIPACSNLIFQIELLDIVK